jgi:hypothetical protein
VHQDQPQRPGTGGGRGADGWFPVNQVTVVYDHATHAADEHALQIDFTNYDLGLNARVAPELDLHSGHVFLARLQSAIKQAVASGLR